VRGQKNLDHRSDLYSAGVVLFECVTGRVPFVSTTFNELVFEIALGPVLDPEVSAPGLDPQFAGVIRKAMAREIHARYQTAAEFAQAISDWMQGANIPVPPSVRAPMGSAASLSATPFPGSAPLAGNTPFPANTPIPGNTPLPANNSNPGILAGPSLAKSTASGSVVTAPGLPAPKRSGGGLWAGVAIGTLVVGGVAFGVMRASMSGHAANSAPSAVSSLPTAATQPSASPSPAAAVPSAPVVVLAPSAEEPPVSASASAPARPSAAPSSGVAVHHPVGPTPPAASAEKSTTTVKGRTIRTEL
jgi:serine/threonine-protein kinase